MADIVDTMRAAVSDRAELPGMSLMEHLAELRKRIIHSVVYLLIGFCVAYFFHERLYGIVQAPLDKLGIALNYTHPTDGLNLYIKTSLYGGFILASPFILYQLWRFISPGMYANEKRYVLPFMGVTILLFLGGAWFGYHYVFPGALNILINGFARKFHPMLTIEDYTGFFLAIVLGLGVTFELPIVMFFLALFGIVDAKFLMRHIRYAILIIFIVAGIICPMPDPLSMCIFAAPMLVLYMLGVLAAFIVHPARRKARKATSA
jgi:sec-independent protein translocase protein TatC